MQTTDTYGWHIGADFEAGQRVEIHPAMDEWMAGDRFGTVTGVTNSGLVRIRLDRSGRFFRILPENLRYA